MTYADALGYIHAVHWQGHKPGLARIRALLDALGRPQAGLRFVHVAGTNGKGSTCAMLESCLRCSGYRVGLFTSPYIQRFNERIQVDGVPIPDEALCRLVERVRPAAVALADVPTEFEIITALGMLWFAETACDIVVLEVGLGGALDSTNVIPPPDCAVITALGMDHVKELGPTLADIAAAKAGIIKPGSPVVSYGGAPEADRVIAAAAATEIEGVGGLSTNLSSDIAELLGGKKNLSKGIRITMVEESVRVDVSLLIKYGYTIVDVAKEVQNAVYNAIENTSGLSVEHVNVHVAGIVFDKDHK